MHLLVSYSDAKQKMKCWACGLFWHKKDDTICKAEGGSIHDSTPTKAKRKFNAGNERTNGKGPSVIKPDGICRFFSRNGNFKFGANCKFGHDETETQKRNKKVKFSFKDRKNVNALKTKVTKGIQDSSQDEIDELVRGFLIVRTIPRERVSDEINIINALNTCLVDMASFAYGTGAGNINV
jgi:hypothetical protein